MGCLYCGKEIGAFRLLRGDEFCSPAHRKLYGERLGKALDRIGTPEPAPVGIAGFLLKLPINEGRRTQSSGHMVLAGFDHPVDIQFPFSMEITPIYGDNAIALRSPEIARPPERELRVPTPHPPKHPVRLPNCLPAHLAAWSGIPEAQAAQPAALVAPSQPIPAQAVAMRGGSSFLAAVGLPVLPMDGQKPVDPPVAEPWKQRPVDSPARQVRLTAPSAFCNEIRPKLPSFACEIGQAGFAGTDKWRRTTPSDIAVPASRPRAFLEALPGEASAIRLPGVDSLSPTQDLMRHVQVAPPAGLVPLADALPAEAIPVKEPFEPTPILPAAKPAAPIAPVAFVSTKLPHMNGLPDSAHLEFKLGQPISAKVPRTDWIAAPGTSETLQLFTPAIAPALATFVTLPERENTGNGRPSLPGLEALGWSAPTARAPETPQLRTTALLMAGFSAPAEAQPAGAPLASAGANAAPVEWAPRPMSLASLDQGLAVEASLAPFVSAPVPNAAELTASSVAPVSAVEWPRASALRIRTAELSLASERSLAAFAEMAPASPAQPSAVIISNATPVSSQANLRLPGFETQVDAAAPAVAPANSLAHPAQPAAAESRSTACEIPSPKLQLPKFIPAGANNETETIPLVPRPVSYEAPAAEFRPQPIPAAPPTALPQFTAETRPELAVTDFDRSYPPAAAPAPGDVQADLSPIAQLPAKPQAIDAECEVSSVPSPSFVPVEFHVQRASAWSRWTPGWNWPVIDTLLPDFQMEVVEDRNEEPLVVAPEPKPASNPAEVFTMPEAKRISRKPVWDYAFKIAACLVMATVLWFGGHAINLGSQSLMANRALTPAEAADAGAVASAGGAAVPATPAPPSGFWARSRVAMANRATVEVADNFKNGMEAWGSSAHSWAPGWARDPSGYVRPGTLQLLQPTKSFRDYRMEFFGQIESKGIGWVMRGQDKENYYAMKFQVVQDGLRPVIAMVHYPVVAGKKGRRVETPLDVMIHHNEPFRVAVDVVGNRFTASIEGQKIDSWVDEAPASGAAGLFAEANEKARIYWMKVTKNDDWIGHICSYLSGGSSDVAELWGPGIPGGNPLPGQPQRVPDMMVAEMDSFNFEKMSKVGRNKIWKS